MSDSTKTWVEQILAGDRRAVGRAISAIENSRPGGRALIRALFPESGRAFLVGVTGAPGAGKSTLVEKLAAAYRAHGQRVGIIAVDPTSPFTGGAILGDRIRMQNLAGDEGVYIRSMATRGHLGGLSPAVHDAATILDAAGCRVILIETVGVGQDEVEIAQYADAIVLLLAPGLGDDVQTFKAGVMEIADIYAINKADRPGAERLEQEINAMLAISPRKDGWERPVVRTIATTGEGMEALDQALARFREFQEKHSLAERRRKERARTRLVELLRQRLLEEALQGVAESSLEEYVEEIASLRRDPHSAVESITRGLLGRKTQKRVT
jgi:LAO/AO transport system kinase